MSERAENILGVSRARMKKALAEADSVLAGAHRGAELELAEHASVFLTDYEKSGPDGVERIIARARASQWDIESSIPWDHTLPDYEAAAVNDRAGRRSAQELWGVEEWGEWRRHILGYTLSQLLHGEQIGILGSAREVELGQTLDVKTACLCSSLMRPGTLRQLSVIYETGWEWSTQ